MVEAHRAEQKKRWPDFRGIRPATTYNLREIAEFLDRTIITVTRWIHELFPAPDVERPFLNMGTDMKVWSKDFQLSKNRGCKSGQLSCFRYRKPREPASRSVSTSRRNRMTFKISPECRKFKSCDHPQEFLASGRQEDPNAAETATYSSAGRPS